MKRALLALFLAYVLLSGCGEATAATAQQVQVQEAGVRRFVDQEAGVACWIYEGQLTGNVSGSTIIGSFSGKIATISCMPLSQTQLVR